MTDRDAFIELLDAEAPTDREQAADLAAVLARRPTRGRAPRIAALAAAAAAIGLVLLRPSAPPDSRLWLRLADRPDLPAVSLVFSHARSADMSHLPAPVLTVLSTALVSCALAADKPSIAVDFEDAEAGQVMTLLAQREAREVAAPDCASKRRVDLQLDNAPASAAWTLLESQLDLTLHRTPDTIYVQCGGPPELPRDLADRRVSLDLGWRTTSDALDTIATAAGLAGARLDGPEQGAKLMLMDVRLETALAATAESFKLGELYVEEDILVGRVVTPLKPGGVPTERVIATLEPVLSGALPCGADPRDRASAMVVLDDAGRIVQAEVTDVQSEFDEVAACVRDAVAAMAGPGDEPAGLAAVELPLSAMLAGGDADDPRAQAILDRVDAEGAVVRCEGSICLLEVVVESNRAVADLMGKLEVAELGPVYLVNLTSEPRGDRRARIRLGQPPE